MNYRLGSIGCGNMGTAILQGALRSGSFAAGELGVCVRSEASAARCRALGFAVEADPRAIYTHSELVLLAIKPQGMAAMFDLLAPADAQASPVVVSIVAGLTEARIRARLPHARVILVMPNTPLLLGCGATALSRGAGVSDAEFGRVRALFAAMGEVREVPAALQNEMIPVNGSSPAFVYYMIEALARWAEAQGIAYDDALALTAKTFEGAARMVLAGEDDPKTLIRKVCSPGGATLEGMRVLDERRADDVLAAAADACVRRAYELGK